MTTDSTVERAPGSGRAGSTPPAGVGEGAPSRARGVKGGPAVGEVPALTIEGWYALHQLFTVDRAAARALPADRR